ncbi:AI-2E family transporter [Nocardioides sp. AX2bis]|uniref:AI-2E family transporter n=1 Tax=Nocardioides sp. AX2bis TaxID=2653157 RepID=UPI0013584DB2|nr:AI-2E family transporter [Nocardioides sp. AX2bis]
MTSADHPRDASPDADGTPDPLRPRGTPQERQDDTEAVGDADSVTASARALDPGAMASGVRRLSTWTLRLLVLVVGAIVLGMLVGKLWSILLPLVLALVLTTVLEPPARLLERRLHVPRALSSASVVLLFVAVFGGLIALLAPTASDEVVELALSASKGLNDLESFVADLGVGVTDAQIESVVAAAQDRLQASAATIASGVLVGLGAVANLAVNAVVTLVLTFFFLKDGGRFLPFLRRWTSPTAGHHLIEVSTRSWITLGSFVRTQALVGLIDAVFIGTGLLLLQVPLALPLAVITFLAAFAPIVGAVTVGALAVLVALAANGWVTALIVLGLVLAVQQLEGNVLLPWLQGRSLDLHAGVVLLAIVLGSTLFGVIGAFLAVPTAAVGVVVARYLHEQASAEPVADILRREEEAPPE